jgi:thioesterase domain-containing protein
MACRLTAAGEQVDPLLLVDTYVHERCLAPRGRAWLAVTRRARLVARGLRDPGRKLPRFLRRVIAKVPRFASVQAPDTELELPAMLRYVEQVNTTAYERYCPQPYEGSVVFIRARRHEPRECNPLPIWSRVVDDLTVQRVPAGHFDMLTDPHVDEVALMVDATLLRAGQLRNG